MNFKFDCKMKIENDEGSFGIKLFKDVKKLFSFLSKE